MRVVITGADGQIGHELVSHPPAGWLVSGLARTALDLTDIESIRSILRQLQPDLVINAAAYTAVDKAESEPELATAVNATAVGVIGEQAAKLGAAVVHFSTDYVFDGTSQVPYHPDATPNPRSVYGWSKLAGEQALSASKASSIILRTCWVYGLRGRNFLMTMLKLAQNKPQLRVVNDQVGCPTWSRAIADATWSIVQTSLAGGHSRRNFGGHEGTYHLASSGSTTWFDFARRIFELANPGQAPEVLPISSAEYAATAQRPAYSVLDCTQTKATFGVALEHWDTMLQRAMRER